MYRVRFLCYHLTSPVPPPLPHSQLSLSQHKVKNLETLMPLKTNRIKKGVVDQLWVLFTILSDGRYPQLLSKDSCCVSTPAKATVPLLFWKWLKWHELIFFNFLKVRIWNFLLSLTDNQIFFFFLGGGVFLLILFHRYKYKIYPPSRSVYDTHIYITCPYTYISLESISVPGVAVK